MSCLLVYYSRSGNNYVTALELSKRLGCEMERVEDGVNRESRFGLMRSIVETLLRIKPRINKLSRNIADYDLVILSTPVWMGKIPSPMRTFVYKYADQISRYVLLSVSGKGDNPEAMSEIVSIVGGHPELIYQISTKPFVESDEKMIVQMEDKDVKSEYFSHELDNLVGKLKSIV